jgi:serine/threonine protein kinase
MNVDSLLAAAQALPPEKRTAFLDTACAGDDTLRQRIAALLASWEATAEFHPSTPSTDAYVGPSNLAHAGASGAVIADRYVLEEKLGAGGMGEVWAARQMEPVKRRVALKLVQAGIDSQTMLARFEHERQALALMDHPHIAKVLDGGLTRERRPFFVMELVDGLPLTQFCDKAHLGIRQRLELFVSICQAVQHAHQKGIIHRDLKPGNVLVALVDGRPVPKVIDFGVAKATGGKLTDETLATQFGAVLGTLEYMAPEQAGLASADVDTRADIYALGVILYELLTGLRPFDSKRLRETTFDEAVRIVRDEEPPPPSH